MSTGNELVTLKQVDNYYKDLRDRQESLVKSYEKLTFPINKGTLCIYDGLTYISQQDIHNSEPWTSSHWTETNISEELTDVKNAIQGILVEKTIGESVTLTNIENAYDFVGTAQTGGFERSYNQETKIAKWVTDGSSEKSPYARHNIAAGTKKWVFGFKYKLTKSSQSVEDPQMFRVYLGTTSYDTTTLVFNEWVNFEKTVEFDLTRIYVILRNFTTAPAANTYQLEIKDMYLYDATGVSSELCALIHEEQRTNYKDGTVTYGETSEGYYPDTSLTEEGKTADSKAVGDAISTVRLNVKEHGVKGDGATDDTDAINALFANSGIFYFPAGTYKISGTVTLPENSEMYGDGTDTVIDMYSCDELDEYVFRGNDKIYPYIVVQENSKLADFKLTGNNTLQQKRHGGICAIGTTNCIIENLTVYNINYDPEQDDDADVSGYGICVTRSSFVTVRKCNVEQCGYECIGIIDNCRYCTVRDCYTKNGWRTCMQVHRGSCDTVIQNCIMIQDHTKYDSCFAVHGLPSYEVVNLTVDNCVMECLQNGAQKSNYCAPAQIMGDTVNLCFTNNKISGGKRAFYINSNHKNAKIIGNDMQCNDTSDYGVYIQSYDTVVIGNVLKNEAQNPVNSIANNPIIVGNIGIS